MNVDNVTILQSHCGGSICTVALFINEYLGSHFRCLIWGHSDGWSGGQDGLLSIY